MELQDINILIVLSLGILLILIGLFLKGHKTKCKKLKN